MLYHILFTMHLGLFQMDDEEHQHSDLPTKTVLRITHFWKIYVSFISISLISSFVGSFQKAFGQK